MNNPRMRRLSRAEKCGAQRRTHSASPPAGTAECPPERSPAGGHPEVFRPTNSVPAGREEDEKARPRNAAGALHRIVVVGGGAAGLELVTRLGERLGRRRRAQVTLVECARAHLWKPLLREVAAGSLDPGDYEVNYLAQAHWHGSVITSAR